MWTEIKQPRLNSSPLILCQPDFRPAGQEGACPLCCEPMEVPTLFGLFAVTAMLIFYALEDRSPWFSLAFACACTLGSVYGFLPEIPVG